MLATIRGEPTDRIPWAPRMDLWYIALRARNELPREFEDCGTVQIADILGAACHAVGADFTRSDGRDVSLRGLGVDNHQDYPYRVVLDRLPVDSSDDGVDLTTRISTSKGEVFTHLHRTPDMARAGISLPFFKSHAIESVDDFDKVAEVFEHLEVVPTPDAYNAFHERVGERGLAVARGPIAASPIHLILHELVAMDQFFYLYMDVREAMHELATRMEPFFHRALDALLTCDAEVILWGGNYDQDLTWPPFFEEEITPWLQMVSDRVHEAGKLLLTHTDGENEDLLALYPSCRIDVAESVCPSPMTRCTLEEIRKGMGPDTTVWGGIPSVSLLPDTMSDSAFESYLDEIFDHLGSGERLIFGVSDNVPPDADLSRLTRIASRIEDFGPV
jgi:hypothetical protein